MIVVVRFGGKYSVQCLTVATESYFLERILVFLPGMFRRPMCRESKLVGLRAQMCFFWILNFYKSMSAKAYLSKQLKIRLHPLLLPRHLLGSSVPLLLIQSTVGGSNVYCSLSGGDKFNLFL